jgi:hypothetical protein
MVEALMDMIRYKKWCLHQHEPETVTSLNAQMAYKQTKAEADIGVIQKFSLSLGRSLIL